MEGVLLLVTIAAAGVALLLLNRRLDNRRSGRIRQLADERAWSWLERDDTLATRWSGPPFRQFGENLRGGDVVSGDHRGWRFTAFQYSYTVSPRAHLPTTSDDPTGGAHSGWLRRGTSRSTFHYRVWAVELPAALPQIAVGPEGIFGGRVARAFGFDRVQLGDPAFDRRYKVACDDAEFASAVLHPGMRQLLVGARPWHWRIEGSTMLSYQRRKLSAGDIVARLDAMCDVLDQIPPQLWDHYGVAG